MVHREADVDLLSFAVCALGNVSQLRNRDIERRWIILNQSHDNKAHAIMLENGKDRC
jgi:hypothetical protein